MSKPILLITLGLGAGLSVQAGDLHGKVACKGVRDSSNAVVYVTAVPGKTFTPPKEHAVVDQKNLVFIPHVLPVQVGTTVDFKNDDAVLHNVFSPEACCNKFNLGTWPQGQSRSYTFANECQATLLCKVHPEMEGFVVACPTPYYAVTKADGSYEIKNVPDGQFTVKVWHPKLKGTQKAVKVAGNTEVGFEIAR
jgi:plastocyanin